MIREHVNHEPRDPTDLDECARVRVAKSVRGGQDTLRLAGFLVEPPLLSLHEMQDRAAVGSFAHAIRGACAGSDAPELVGFHPEQR